MQLHELRPKHKLKKKKRIGRGGKRGTYSGRGVKGQRARAGRKFKPIIRELIKRYPKLRGYKFNRLVKKPAVVNIGSLEKKFHEGEIVKPESLLEKGLIRKEKGTLPKVKILSRGDLKKILIIEGCQLSNTAREKIKKVGGKINPINS